jgi:hypothetical protein
MKVASLWRRWGAAVVELFVFYVSNMLSVLCVLKVVSWSPASRPFTTAATIAGLAVVLLFLYGLTEVFGDGTLAKRLFGLRIRGKQGTRLAPALLAERWLIKSLPFVGWMGVGLAIAFGGASGHVPRLLALVLLAGACQLIGFLDIVLALRSSRQAVHDSVVGAMVVRGEAPVPEQVGGISSGSK